MRKRKRARSRDNSATKHAVPFRVGHEAASRTGCGHRMWNRSRSPADTLPIRSTHTGSCPDRVQSAGSGVRDPANVPPQRVAFLQRGHHVRERTMARAREWAPVCRVSQHPGRRRVQHGHDRSDVLVSGGWARLRLHGVRCDRLELHPDRSAVQSTPAHRSAVCRLDAMRLWRDRRELLRRCVGRGCCCVSVSR
jgi:hypothetical protein